jgi:hypothetical protein
MTAIVLIDSGLIHAQRAPAADAVAGAVAALMAKRGALRVSGAVAAGAPEAADELAAAAGPFLPPSAATWLLPSEPALQALAPLPPPDAQPALSPDVAAFARSALDYVRQCRAFHGGRAALAALEAAEAAEREQLALEGRALVRDAERAATALRMTEERRVQLFALADSEARARNEFEAVYARFVSWVIDAAPQLEYDARAREAQRRAAEHAAWMAAEAEAAYRAQTEAQRAAAVRALEEEARRSDELARQRAAAEAEERRLSAAIAAHEAAAASERAAAQARASAERRAAIAELREREAALEARLAEHRRAALARAREEEALLERGRRRAPPSRGGRGDGARAAAGRAPRRRGGGGGAARARGGGAARGRPRPGAAPRGGARRGAARARRRAAARARAADRLAAAARGRDDAQVARQTTRVVFSC